MHKPLLKQKRNSMFRKFPLPVVILLGWIFYYFIIRKPSLPLTTTTTTTTAANLEQAQLKSSNNNNKESVILGKKTAPSTCAIEDDFYQWTTKLHYLSMQEGRGGSQYFQDETIYKLVYKDNINGEICGPHRFFVEFGGSDGVFHSNTIFFERALNWRGFLVEGDPELVKLGKARRSADIVSGVVCPTDAGEVSFYRAATLGLSSLIPKNDGTEEKIIAKCYTLDTLLGKHGIRPGDRVDLLTIDVEGMELKIIQSIPWAKYNFSVVLVELDKGETTPYEVRNFFQATGLYHNPFRIDPNHPDDIYIHKSLNVNDPKTFQVACSERCRVPFQCASWRRSGIQCEE